MRTVIGIDIGGSTTKIVGIKTDKNGNLLPDSQRITKFGKFIRKTS